MMASHRRTATWSSPRRSGNVHDFPTNIARNHRQTASTSYLSDTVGTSSIAPPPRHHHLHHSNLVGTAASANEEVTGTSSLPYDSRFPNRAAFEADCRKRGMCPRCGNTRTHKIRKTFIKTIAEPLTVTDDEGKYTVYKGHHIGPMCFTVKVAKQILGELDRRGGENGEIRTGGLMHRHMQELEPEDMRRATQARERLNSSDARLNFDPTADPSILDYTGQKLSPSDVQAIIHFKLLEDGQVKTLLLDHCGLGDDGIRSLVNALLHVQPAHLKIICLRKNKIGKDGARELARLFQQTESPSFALEEVRLSHNKIEDDGVALLFRALQYVEQSSLRSISLSYNNITQKGAAAIGAALAENNILESIRLDHNRLRDAGLQDICLGIARNPTSRMSDLSLRNNVISNAGAHSLASLLARHRKRLRVIIARNEIENDGAKAIFDAMVCCGSGLGSIVLGLDDKNRVTDGEFLMQVVALIRDRRTYHQGQKDSSIDNEEDNQSHDSLGAGNGTLPPAGCDASECAENNAAAAQQILPAMQPSFTHDQQAACPPQQQKKAPESNCHIEDQQQTVFRIDSALARELTESLHIEDMDEFLRNQQEAFPLSSSHHDPLAESSHHDTLAQSFHHEPTFGSSTPPTVNSSEHDSSNPSPSMALRQTNPNLYTELREAFPDIDDLDAFLREQTLFESSDMVATRNNEPAQATSKNDIYLNQGTAISSGSTATTAVLPSSLVDGMDPAFLVELQKMFPNSQDLEEFLREQQYAAQHLARTSS